MNIIINEDDIYLNNSKIVKGQIYFKVGQSYFPDENWSDFVSVIIGWWIYGFFDSVKCEKDFEFYFMDGSYKVYGERKEKDKCILKYIETSGKEEMFVEYENIPNIKEELIKVCKKLLCISEMKGFSFSNHKELEKKCYELEKMQIK